MNLEGIRIIADAMADPTNGVNAKIPGVPRDAGDAQPPLLVAVLDVTRADPRARAQTSTDWPILMCRFDDRSTIEGESSQTIRDATELPIALDYIVTEPDQKRQDAGYTMRAVLRVLDWLQSHPPTRNEVQLHQITEIQAGLADTPPETQAPNVAATATARLHLRDIAPGG